MLSRHKVRCIKRFLLGLFIGIIVFQITLWMFRKISFSHRDRNEVEKSQSFKFNTELYETDLSDSLFDEVKVLCWIMISPKFHRSRGVHIKNTWGRRCNKILFMSSVVDPELDSIALPVKEKINRLWSKTREAFKYINEHHLNDADWFLKADDDTYIVMENLRHLLYQYRPQTSLYFGQRLTDNETLEGFMQGGAYILSRKAVQKFVKHFPNCRRKDAWAEDKYMGERNQ